MELDTRLRRVEDALDRLAEAQARTETAVARLATAQARTEERVGRLEGRMEQVEAALVRLAAAQARTDEQLAQLTTQVQALTEAQTRTEEQLARQNSQLQALLSWQRGEAGRREGARYERDVVRRAGVLFNGGHGGSPEQPEIQRRLTGLLRTVPTAGILPAEDDPSLADLLWWKGNQLAVVETAIQVNGEDVSRAAQRARTLRRGGTQAMAVVIGEHWATLDTQERSRALGVDWKVGADLSDGFLAFRRLPNAEDGIE
jgi:TolA-binding protein